VVLRKGLTAGVTIVTAMRHLARKLFSLYFVITFLAIPVSAFCSMTGWWPSRLRVPWSDLGSFVETKDGIVLVEIRMWGRIERYDSNGKFLDSWREPAAKGDVALATDEQGNVYLRHANIVYQFDASGRVQKKYSADPFHLYSLPRNWELSASSGEPQYAPKRSQFFERKIVKPGQLLFSDQESRSFLCADGTQLVSDGSSISRFTDSGQKLMTYRAPHYYWPIQFPVPGMLAWVVCIIVLYAVNLKEKKAESPGPAARESGQPAPQA
jgi:hypothetical protein